MVTFTSDSSIQGSGFSLSYRAAASPSVTLPQCATGEHLVRALMRTRVHGSEVSWVLATQPAQPAAKQQAVLSGGALPAAALWTLPAAVAEAAVPEYHDLRAYATYACLAPGNYTAHL